MFPSDPPASDLAEALDDEDRESDGCVSNATRLWCWRPGVMKAFFGVRSTLSGGSGLSPADQAVLFAGAAAARSGSCCGLAWEAAPAAVRAAVSHGRRPAGTPPV
jgi:hypothetical protein